MSLVILVTRHLHLVTCHLPLITIPTRAAAVLGAGERYRGVRFCVRVRVRFEKREKVRVQFEKREKVRVRVRVRFEKREKVRLRVQVRPTVKGADQYKGVVLHAFLLHEI